HDAVLSEIAARVKANSLGTSTPADGGAGTTILNFQAGLHKTNTSTPDVAKGGAAAASTPHAAVKDNKPVHKTYSHWLRKKQIASGHAPSSPVVAATITTIPAAPSVVGIPLAPPPPPPPPPPGGKPPP